MKQLESELTPSQLIKMGSKFIQQIETSVYPSLATNSHVLLITADNFALLLKLAKKYQSVMWQVANLQSEFVTPNLENLAVNKNILPPCDWRLNSKKHSVNNYDVIIYCYPLCYLPWEEVKNLFYYFNKALNIGGALIMVDCFIDTARPINKYLADLDKYLRLKNKDYSIRDINVIKILGKMQKLALNEDIVLDEFNRLLKWIKLDSKKSGD